MKLVYKMIRFSFQGTSVWSVVESLDFIPICSASESVSGSFFRNVSGKLSIEIDAMRAIVPNAKYGAISRY